MKILASLASEKENLADSLIYDNYASDIFQQVENYYFETFGFSTAKNSIGQKQASIKNPPLLTYDLYELLLANLEMLDDSNVHSQKLNSKVFETFGLALLLLPPNNRRQLHLLLRLISKMCLHPEIYESIIPANQKKILLGKSKILTSTMLKNYLIKNFWPCIFRTQTSHDLEEVLGLKFCSILLENFDSLMQPSNFKRKLWDEVEIIKNFSAFDTTLDLNSTSCSIPTQKSSGVGGLRYDQPSRLRHTSDQNRKLDYESALAPLDETSKSAETSNTHCQKIDVNEYNFNKMPTQALKNLLETIVSDKKATSADKRKRLKNFQATYPSIYFEKFDNETDPLLKLEKSPQSSYFKRIFK